MGGTKDEETTERDECTTSPNLHWSKKEQETEGKKYISKHFTNCWSCFFLICVHLGWTASKLPISSYYSHSHNLFVLCVERSVGRVWSPVIPLSSSQPCVPLHQVYTICCTAHTVKTNTNKCDRISSNLRLQLQNKTWVSAYMEYLLSPADKHSSCTRLVCGCTFFGSSEHALVEDVTDRRHVKRVSMKPVLHYSWFGTCPGDWYWRSTEESGEVSGHFCQCFAKVT